MNFLESQFNDKYTVDDADEKLADKLFALTSKKSGTVIDVPDTIITNGSSVKVKVEYQDFYRRTKRDAWVDANKFMDQNESKFLKLAALRFTKMIDLRITINIDGVDLADVVTVFEQKMTQTSEIMLSGMFNNWSSVYDIDVGLHPLTNIKQEAGGNELNSCLMIVAYVASEVEKKNQQLVSDMAKAFN